MSKNIMVLTGSSRANSAGDKILPMIVEAIEDVGSKAVVADVRKLGLPFFNEKVTPASEGYVPENENAKEFQKMVQGVDGVVLLLPEYNNQMTGIQKNAIDWLYADWKDLPFSVVGYSWGGVESVLDQVDRLVSKIGGVYKNTAAQLYLTKDIDLEGNVLDKEGVKEKIEIAVKSII